jgi:glucose/arabinose dehydrogenase
MQTIAKFMVTAIVMVLIIAADIPLLPVELVPEAQAIFGVRRRTAVIAYSAGSRASSAAAASQQQAAAAQQQTAAAEQEAAAAKQEAAAAQQQLAVAQQAPPTQAVSAVPVGTMVTTLPGKCKAVTVGNVAYQDCGGSFYRAAFQGNNLVYVVVASPL